MDVVSLCNGPTLPCVWVRVYCPLQSAVWYSAECLMLPIKERTKKALLELLLCNPRRTYTHTHILSGSFLYRKVTVSSLYPLQQTYTHIHTESTVQTLSRKRRKRRVSGSYCNRYRAGYWAKREQS